MRTGIVALLLSVAITASAATLILISQIKPDTASAGGSVAVTSPNGGRSAWAKVGSGLSIAGGVISATGTGQGPTPAAEVPAGAINGTNVVFTLSATPVANTQQVFWNGLYLSPSQGDYNISGNTLTMTTPPQTGDSLVVQYWH